jgi:hypothetical protein
MAHQLYIVKNNVAINITPLVGSISWKNSIDTIATSLEFNLAYSDASYVPNPQIDLGNMVILKNGDAELFRGLIISEQRDGRSPISYTSMDFSFYLNKSKEVYQFNYISATNAIKTVLSNAGVSYGEIANMPTIVDKIYTDKTIYDIIKDIIEQVQLETNIKYLLEMRLDKLYIVKREDLLIKSTFKLADNLPTYNNIISNPSRKRSIEEMRNSIKIITTNDDNVTVVATAKNDELIARYGLLQEIESIDEEDIAKARNIARNLLIDLGKVFEENSIDMMGDDNVKAGRLIDIEETITGMSGRYLIKSTNHNLSNGIHRMSLDLEVAQ